MGSRHPLDIFRSTDDGFDHASRRRRTVPGKVLVSSARKHDDGRKAARGAGLLGARGKARAASRPASGGGKRARGAGLLGASRRALSPAALSAEGVSRKLLYGAGVVVVLLGLVLALRSTFVDDGPARTLPLRADALSAAASAELVPEGRPTGGVSTVLAATYPPTEHGLVLAWHAHDELAARGFEAVEVAQLPGPDGGVKAYQLLVGWASADALVDVRAALRALDDWPGQSGRPFAEARVIAHPLGEG